MKLLKQILALILSLCVLLPVFAAGDEYGLEDMELDDEILLDDDFWDDEEDENEQDELYEFIIGGNVEEIEQDLDALERDPDVDPDSLDVNPNLPDNVINILLIGVDSRADSLDSQSSLFHNDVTMILSINKDDGSFFTLKNGNTVLPFKTKVKTTVTSPTLIAFTAVMVTYCILNLVMGTA